jgi:hypothetical protein
MQTPVLLPRRTDGPDAARKVPESNARDPRKKLAGRPILE